MATQPNKVGGAAAQVAHTGQSAKSDKGPADKASSRKKPIDFRDAGRDEKNVSQFSMAILNQIRTEAGIAQLMISSTLRSPAKQADIMYEHEIERHDMLEQRAEDKRRIMRDKAMLDPDHPETRAQYQKDVRTYQLHLRKKLPVNYKGDGHRVQETAQKGINKHEAPSATRAKMTAQIQASLEKGIAVSNHLGLAHLEVIDVEIGKMTPEQKKRFLQAVRRRFGTAVSRIGYPEGPEPGTKTEFRDPHCFHLEVLQVPKMQKAIDTVAIKQRTA